MRQVRRSVWILPGVVAALAVASGIAYATIPDGTGRSMVVTRRTSVSFALSRMRVTARPARLRSRGAKADPQGRRVPQGQRVPPDQPVRRERRSSHGSDGTTVPLV